MNTLLVLQGSRVQEIVSLSHEYTLGVIGQSCAGDCIIES